MSHILAKLGVFGTLRERKGGVLDKVSSGARAVQSRDRL